jgi:hypothetical protein
MDRSTHQPPRQQGYGSTSSLRNDSLKHTWKHERRKGGIEPRNKALRLWRTVRPGGADCLLEPRGPSGLLPRTVCTHTANCPALRRGPSEKATRTSRDDPEYWIVRGEHADCPPGTHGPSARCCGLSETTSNQSSKPKRIESKDEQEHEEHAKNTVFADRPPGPRGPSARHESQHSQSIIGSPKR